MLTDLFLLLVIAALCVAIWRSHKRNIDTYGYIKEKAVRWWVKRVFKQ